MIQLFILFINLIIAFSIFSCEQAEQRVGKASDLISPTFQTKQAELPVIKSIEFTDLSSPITMASFNKGISDSIQFSDIAVPAKNQNLVTDLNRSAHAKTVSSIFDAQIRKENFAIIIKWLELSHPDIYVKFIS